MNYDVTIIVMPRQCGSCTYAGH